MSDTSTKYATMVDRLYQRTINKKIEWSVPEEGVAECVLGAHTVRLDSYRSEENEPFESIDIRNNWGGIVDSFNDTELKGKSPEDEPFSSYYDRMVKLRNMALRQASGADGALDQILNLLDDDLDF